MVPVFVFDLARSDPLLLDRRFVSRAFPDMALLVRTRAAELLDEALAEIADLGPAAEPLRQIARYVVTRES